MNAGGYIRVDKTLKPLSVRDLARKLGISERQVRKAVELGEVRVVTFAGKQLVPQSEVQRIKELFK